MPQPDWTLGEFSYAQGLIVAHYQKPGGSVDFETLAVAPADVPELIFELFKTMDQNLRVDILAQVNAANDRVVQERKAAMGRSIALRLGLPMDDDGTAVDPA
jgi:hypothetical protein